MTRGTDNFWKVFEGIRRITIFTLGVAVVVYALIDPDTPNTVAMLVIGMVMVGILPVENLFGLWSPRRRDRGSDVSR